MGRTEDIMTQAWGELSRHDLTRELKYADLYHFEDVKVQELFSSLHFHLINLFYSMNSRLPTGEGTAHFWADDSRKLKATIETIMFLKQCLQETDYDFTIEKYNQTIINKCCQFLRSSGGSTIPSNMGKINLYESIPIFEFSEIYHKVPCSPIFSCKKLLGEGSYAKVYKYTDQFYQNDFVIKEAKKNLTEKEKERFLIEFQTMKKLSSPYIVQVYGYEKKIPAFFMEKMDETLENYVKRNNNKLDFNFVVRKKLCMQIFKAFSYIHSKGILHRDVSPKNILIKSYDDGSLVVKVADMGLVKTPEGCKTSIETDVKGQYMDPNLRIDGFKNYQIKHEIYALSVVIKYIMSGSTRLDNYKDQELQRFILRGINPDPKKRFLNVEEMKNCFKQCNFATI